MIRPLTVIKGKAGMFTDNRRSSLRLSIFRPLHFSLFFKIYHTKISVYGEQGVPLGNREGDCR